MFGLFKKKKTLLHNFENIGTDMHSHILPGIDDGAKTLEESVSLVLRLKQLGYSKLIASPHIMGDYYRNTPYTINKALQQLQEELNRQNIDIEIQAAAEYYLDEFFETNLSKNNVLTFSGYLLFELSYINTPHNLKEIVSEIRDKGYSPVLAHPERYPYYHNTLDFYEEIKSWGCQLQLNTISLTGYYGKNIQKTADNLIARDLIDFIGTDTHHHRHLDALEKSLTSSRLRSLIAEEKLLNKVL